MLWFKRKDPVCGMKEEKGKGMEKYGKWFCSNKCVKDFEKFNKRSGERSRGGCC